MGSWRRPKKEVEPIVTTPAHLKFIKDSKELFDRISHLLHSHETEKWKEINHLTRKISPMLRPGIFSTCSLNTGPAAIHCDPKDLKGGYSCIIAFGEFIGAPLILPELGLEISLKPGDVCFLDSRVMIFVA